MSYIQQTLIRGEQVLHIGRISLWTLWRPIASGIAAVLAGIALLVVPEQLHYGVGLAVLALGAGFLLKAYLEHATTELAFTNKRIISKTGLISRKTVEIGIAKVESVQVQQTVMGRLLNFGTLSFLGTGAGNAPIPGIHDPLGFRRAFMEALETLRGGK